MTPIQNLSTFFRSRAVCAGLVLLLCSQGLVVCGQDRSGDSLVHVAMDSFRSVIARQARAGSTLDGVDSANLQREGPLFRHLPDSVVRACRVDKDFAYANDPDYWKKPKKKDPENLQWLENFYRFLSGKWFRYFLYVLMGGILAYALYRILKENNWDIFSRTARGKKGAGNAEEEVLAPEDLSALLRDALAAGDYRMSVRYLFLQTLYRLGEKGMIRYHLQGTNQEYLGQMRDQPQAAAFRYLSNAYDHVWYGEFMLNAQQFERLHQYFQDFNRSLEG